MKNDVQKYFIGLDVGTNSVGWAVTNDQYKVNKFNGKSMWGIRLFEEGKTAEDRRIQRAARRRLMRRKQRIALLQEIFSVEISNVDVSFFHRLEESKYVVEDKRIEGRYTLFNDEKFNDIDYHKKYPTIYHLRKDLIVNGTNDARLLYLGLAHIMKHRGHFLFEGNNMDAISDFEAVFKRLIIELNDEFELELVCKDIDEVEAVIKDTNISITAKKKKMEQLLVSEAEEPKTKQIKAICHILIGASVDMRFLLADESLVDDNDKGLKLKFGDGKFEEEYDNYERLLNEKIYYVECMKSIYDWGLLANILKGYEYLSDSKIEIYEKHKSDLKLLKTKVRQYIPEKYKEVFSDTKHKSNYCAYIGDTNKAGKKVKAEKKCSQEDFLKYLRGLFKGVKSENDTDLEAMKVDFDKGMFMPKQVSKDNSVLPYQVHLKELNAILTKNVNNFQFLDGVDQNGYKTVDKINKLFTFKIPYYVGPLNDAHKSENGNCWITKKKDGEVIRPWNFEEVVDIDQCAEDFIKRMTNKCTYLIGADVLPKDSLLYSEFMMLNELNNLRINGEKINYELKNEIINKLFKVHKKVTVKALSRMLKNNGYDEPIEISGIDGDFKSSLQSYIKIKDIIDDQISNTEMVENIIKWIVLFGEDKKLLSHRIKNTYGEQLSNNVIKRLCTLKFSGWGRLSKEFLTEIYHVVPSTGEMISIIHGLRNMPDEVVSKNLMELLSKNYDYIENIEKYNALNTEEYNGIKYDMVEEQYVSPAIKRSIWQTLTIVDEIVKVKGYNPEKIFVEMARGNDEKQGRTKSRRTRLQELYEAIKGEQREWLNELEGKTDGELRSDKLYLYYTQMGRCMYSGEKIDLDRLADDNLYDIDHIYPQSRVKDDSISNRVLVKKKLNMEKSNEYPLSDSVRTSMYPLWKSLFDKDLISKKKFERLTRSIPFSEHELADFIARQVVETRQSTKVVADLLNKVYEDSRIVYVKAGNVNRFKQHFGIVKVRELNDYHHAKDAYLNIVVGNVYDTKFTSNPYNFVLKNSSYSLNEKVLFGEDLIKNGRTAWEKDKTIGMVKKQVGRNNILFTRYSYEQKGQMFKVLPVGKGKGQLSLKGEKRLRDISRYGGYNSVAGAYFVLVDHEVKKSLVRSIEFVPIYLSEGIEKDKKVLDNYLKDNLGLINHKVVLPKIKIDSLFKVDGFLMHVTGRTGVQLIFKHALQLVIDAEHEKYLKKVVKYYNRMIKRIRLKQEVILPTEFDGITNCKNLAIYDVFYTKISDTIYAKRMSAQIEKFQKGRDKFVQLTEFEQCTFIVETMHLFQCNSVTSDIRLIGGPKNAGKLLMSKNISKNGVAANKIYVINQSPTGLFQQEVDLVNI